MIRKDTTQALSLASLLFTLLFFLRLCICSEQKTRRRTRFVRPSMQAHIVVAASFLPSRRTSTCKRGLSEAGESWLHTRQGYTELGMGAAYLGKVIQKSYSIDTRAELVIATRV